MISPERLQEIKARVEKATPGPWKVEKGPKHAPDYERDLRVRCEWDPPRNGTLGYELFRLSGVNHETRANAEFTAHSRKDVPDLLEEVKRLNALLGAIVLAAGDQSKPRMRRLADVRKLAREGLA